MRLIIMTMLLGSAVVACSADGRSGGGGVDAAPVRMDAALPPDAAIVAKQIGSACIYSQTDPAGDCGAGFVCLPPLPGGHGSWCTKTCTRGAGDTCAAGYTGHGRPECLLMVTVEGGASSQVCDIICQTVNAAECPATVCDQMCPGPLTCTAPLTYTDQSPYGKACQ